MNVTTVSIDIYISINNFKLVTIDINTHISYIAFILTFGSLFQITCCHRECTLF